MQTSGSLPERGNDSFIKFQVQSDYDYFVEKLKNQLKNYSIKACQDNQIEIGSEDAKLVESILLDVFMKYTLEFMRENFLVEGRPIDPSPEFATSDSSRHPNGMVEKPATKSHHRKKNDKQPPTRPCDTALNERVIRQQYALYDAAVGNTRKRKDLAAHILQRVEEAAQKANENLQNGVKEAERAEEEHQAESKIDPFKRWQVLNAELPKMTRIQEDYTDANKNILSLIESTPGLIDTADRAIKLHEEISTLLKTS
ncbi:hypothetical protein O181_089850 [Austropuccinia psidii MF-1]|uniref:Uncharacterized protein n=1 Tax=Austropuccinia psidii MF-1 TaxID=1389203 RepID=A0A9Q3IUN7_9BASI|nr:hypothetical protein [Austropuccinia psidii MF-1]